MYNAQKINMVCIEFSRQDVGWIFFPQRSIDTNLKIDSLGNKKSLQFISMLSTLILFSYPITKNYPVYSLIFFHRHPKRIASSFPGNKIHTGSPWFGLLPLLPEGLDIYSMLEQRGTRPLEYPSVLSWYEWPVYMH